MGLKDVIVFSSKGNLPLAKKLSGGDYDGDIAWVCWEPSLVTNFHNADFPDVPDLIKQGHIEKDTTTYRDLLLESEDVIATFLERSLHSNLQENLLGVCTSYREKFCYAFNNVESQRAIFLSTLVSSLVDQAKQGYRLTLSSWSNNIRQNVIKFDGRQPPAYKGDTAPRRCHHIIEHLKFEVAHQTGEKFDKLP